MAKTPKPDPKPAPQQQGDDKPAGQMTGTTPPKPQQGQPIYRDWAAI
jgi:hypothetical protein